ncbi:hypothetical protein F53441_7604 [Fusarium austroafricanum]|uniref:Apple domain-containing protein n=1 Tax=Fusarium austroafricanum TaxID=2364996 RepID=A0A8H4KF65_9HYPO|nr:hypothetical protein F53441_7604 [Fusarium austroafricanum]
MAFARVQEGLEVYSDNEANAPELNPHDAVYNHSYKDPSPEYIRVVEPWYGPFGLSAWSLCAVVAVVTALIVGAGVGGGLGAALAQCNKSSHKSEASPAPALETSCPTKTASDSEETGFNSKLNYKPLAPEDVTFLTFPDGCSKPEGKGDYTTKTGYMFTYTCGWDFVGNDLAKIIAYSAYDCMHACAKYTEMNQDEENATLCDSVAFNRNMSESWDLWKANCWLKFGSKKLFPDNEKYPGYLYAKRNK